MRPLQNKYHFRNKTTSELRTLQKYDHFRMKTTPKLRQPKLWLPMMYYFRSSAVSRILATDGIPRRSGLRCYTESLHPWQYIFSPAVGRVHTDQVPLRESYASGPFVGASKKTRGEIGSHVDVCSEYWTHVGRCRPAMSQEHLLLNTSDFFILCLIVLYSLLAVFFCLLKDQTFFCKAKGKC